MDFVNLEFADERVKKVQAVLSAVRSSQANVLISGPAGSGKSSLAKHLLSSLDYIILNTLDLVEEFDFLAFFEKSANRAFLIENIERLSSQQQKSLYEALNGSRPNEKNRVVSTSRHSLKVMVQKAQFREDLYYRLTVLNLELPALGQRLSDIEILAEHLVNVLERAVILAEHSIIEAAHITIENQEIKADSVGFSGMTLSQVEQKLILQTLQLTEQNRTRAAEILGISIRTLRNKINEYRQAGLV